MQKELMKEKKKESRNSGVGKMLYKKGNVIMVRHLVMNNTDMFTGYKWNLLIFQLFESVRGTLNFGYRAECRYFQSW